MYVDLCSVFLSILLGPNLGKIHIMNEYDVCTFSSNGHQSDTLGCNEVQSFVDISDFMEPHLSSVRLGELFPRDHF